MNSEGIWNNKEYKTPENILLASDLSGSLFSVEPMFEHQVV
jgi:hypothetical protein